MAYIGKKPADKPLSGSDIADDIIDSQHYAAGSIDNEHIADDAIDSEHYATGSIDNEHIADDAIDSEHYAAGSIDNEHLADDAVGIDELSATGTASSSTFLRGDNTWATPTDTNTMGSGFTVSATTDSNATTITQGDDLMFTAGTGITCETTADGTVTITNTVTDTNTTYSAGDFKLDDLGAPDDNTDLDFTTSVHGLVPKGTNTGNYLKDDGTWAAVGGIPSGVITMWSGAISAIPAGWVICDGTNSTPNLTDRFVIHADADSGGTNDVGDTGGSHTATPLGSVGTSGAHTLSTSEMPSHTHTYNYQSTTSYSGGHHASHPGDTWEGTVSTNTGSTGSGGSHTHTGGTFTGSSTTVTPKYYALAYIMKT